MLPSGALLIALDEREANAIADIDAPVEPRILRLSNPRKKFTLPAVGLLAHFCQNRPGE
jgi:hypothetical protein